MTKAKRARRKAAARDPFDQLLAARFAAVGSYRPYVGYLHADGSVSSFSSENMSWLNFDRAVSSCFGSAARRLRGLRSPNTNDSPIVAILMLVMGGNGEKLWKHRVDIPAEIGS